MTLRQDFDRHGWLVLPHDAGVAYWADAAHSAALDVTADPAMQSLWLRHGGTWFVGVDALPNNSDGSVGGTALAGPWQDFIELPATWHKAQLSVVHPGYPGRDPGETDAAHRFRRDRDAAHLDGLLAEGPAKRRFLREPHAFILGLPLTPMTPDTGAFVVWDGGHHVINQAFSNAYAGHDSAYWANMDVTDIYQVARQKVFETCPRRVVVAQPGQAILVHRQAIHGSAPWADGAVGPKEGRMIAWFRPILPDPANWLDPL